MTFVGFGADGQLDLRAAVIQLGRNADDAHARRKNLLEVHEDFGPGKAALADERIQEGGAVEDLFGLGGLKIGFERGLLSAIDANFVLPAGNFRAQIAAGAPGSVGGVAEQQENEQADDGQSAPAAARNGRLLSSGVVERLSRSFMISARHMGRSGTSVEHPANQRIQILMDQILRAGIECMGLV